MLRLLLVRLTLAVPVLILVSMVAFFLLRLAPGDPAQLQAGPDASPEVVQAIRRELALDEPLPLQYAAWASKALQGNLGVSYSSRQPVVQLIGERLPVTAQIGTLALVLSIIVGVPL